MIDHKKELYPNIKILKSESLKKNSSNYSLKLSFANSWKRLDTGAIFGKPWYFSFFKEIFL